MLSRVWKSRVSSPCSELGLIIEDYWFTFSYKSVIGWTLSFNCQWDFSPNSTNRLVKEILYCFHKLPLVNFDGLLSLSTINCYPEFAFNLHEPYMELLKRFDSVRQLFLGDIKVSTDAMNFLQSPRVFSASADSEPEEGRLLFPNLQRVMLGKIWEHSEAHANAINHFAAERDKFGAPIEVVDCDGAPVKMPLTARPWPRRKVEVEKESKEEKEGEEEDGGEVGEEAGEEEEEVEREGEDEDDWVDE
ncbi:hypothetical protein H1R20_g8378, partial [Candolleomyces eurysporus]